MGGTLGKRKGGTVQKKPPKGVRPGLPWGGGTEKEKGHKSTGGVVIPSEKNRVEDRTGFSSTTLTRVERNWTNKRGRRKKEEKESGKSGR